jgi:hypothetical protein
LICREKVSKAFRTSAFFNLAFPLGSWDELPSPPHQDTLAEEEKGRRGIYRDGWPFQ